MSYNVPETQKETLKKDVTVKNIEKVIQANKDRIEKKIELSKKERIDKGLEDLQKTVNEAYSDDYTFPYVFYGISREGEEGRRHIDAYVHPEAIKRFKEKTGFRCLKIKQTQFHLLFWRYQPIYRFVITHLTDNEELLKAIEESGFVDWHLKIVKEY